MKINVRSCFLFAALLAVPSLVLAHENTGNGLVAGFTHPVLGLDHLLAMLSVGILSAQIGGKAVFRVPATFVVIMVVGGAMGLKGLPFPAVELGIALSVAVLGAAIAVGRKFPVWISMVFVGIFALFHGYAHGMEMPDLADPYLYAFGFVLSTSLIHLAGVLIGFAATKTAKSAEILRYMGAVIAGMGLHIILSA